LRSGFVARAHVPTHAPRDAPAQIAKLLAPRRWGEGMRWFAGVLFFLLTATAFPCRGDAAPIGDTDAVDFQSDGVTLSGSIVFPIATPPIAALVLIHGSGKVERMLPLARLLAAEGFAVLTYDKRGVGHSGGVYEGEDNVSAKNLNLLAADASAAMTALKRDPRLRKVPAGFIGVSQAGWVIPLAAIKSPGAKFVALWSGPVCTVSEQLHFQNLAANDVDFWKTHTSQQVTGYMKSVRYRSDDVDPRESLSKLSIPGLWLFGGQDNLAPVDLSVSRLKDLIADGHRNFSYKIFPEYGHNIADSSGQSSVQYMVAWLKETAAAVKKS
jgi:pimeloyl-ACP methyl ester carboxylesterase